MNISKDLKIEIHTNNEFNRVVKIELAHILPLLVKFVGKKIFTLKGRAKTFEVEFAHINNKVAIPVEFEKGHAMVYRCFFTNQYNKLTLRYCLCFNGGSYDTKPTTAYTKYVERDIELGILDNNEKLSALFDFDEIVSSYGFNRVLNVDEETKAIEDYAKYKVLAEQAKSKIKVSSDIYKYV